MIKLLLLLFLIYNISCVFSVDTKTTMIQDELGRNRFFHGVNTVYKIFPFYPNTETFNTNNSLCEQDFVNLRGWGMNIIRLHVAWEGVQPTRNFINQTYILKLRDIVRMAAKHNITVLLDSHQDLFSKKFCGQGFPDWTVNRTTFPWPLPVKIRFDKQGYPLRQDCEQIQFAEYYLTRDVNKFQQDFFSNKDGLADEFGKMWQEVIRFMRYEPNIIGYEIINQPIGANLYKNPVHAAAPNMKFLLPFYKKIYQKMRQVDSQNLIFFEPSFMDIAGLGFISTPGGESQLSKQVFSYHIYCGIVTPEGEPLNQKLCEAIDLMTLSTKSSNTNNLKIGGMLTQFGALSNTHKSAEEILRVTRAAEKRHHSWIYWQFKYYYDVSTQSNPPSTQSFYYDNGTLQSNKVTALSHPYAYAVCGDLIESTFTTASYRLIFKPSKCRGDTEIYINEPYYFPDSFSVKFEPACEECRLSFIEKSYYKVLTPNSLLYHKITLDIIGHL